MTIDVTLPQPAEALTRYRFAYLVTVGIGEDARAHVVAVPPTKSNDTLRVPEPGRKTRAALAAHPSVTVVWPCGCASDCVELPVTAETHGA